MHHSVLLWSVCSIENYCYIYQNHLNLISRCFYMTCVTVKCFSYSFFNPDKWICKCDYTCSSLVPFDKSWIEKSIWRKLPFCTSFSPFFAKNTQGKIGLEKGKRIFHFWKCSLRFLDSVWWAGQGILKQRCNLKSLFDH